MLSESEAQSGCNLQSTHLGGCRQNGTAPYPPPERALVTRSAAAHDTENAIIFPGSSVCQSVWLHLRPGSEECLKDKSEKNLTRAAEAIETFLRSLGAPVDNDPELKRTGIRVAQAFSEEFLSGYQSDESEIFSRSSMSQTEHLSEDLVGLFDMPTTLMCPHHLLPSPGVTHVVYQPGYQVIGFGAVAKLVEHHSRRLILQEDYTRAVAESIARNAKAQGCLCVAELTPTCMTTRGPRSHGTRSVTRAFAFAGDEKKNFQTDALALLARQH